MACVAAKLAVTLLAAFIVTVQVLAAPAQAPPQPVKALPLKVTAVNVTLVLSTKLAEQLAPQSIPAGVLVIVPSPDLTTDNL